MNRLLAAALLAPLAFMTPTTLGQEGESTLVPPGVEAPADKAADVVDPGRELFKQAAQSVRDAKSITYRVKTYGTGSFDAFTSKIDAKVRMLRAAEAGTGVNGWLISIQGTATTRQATDDPIHVVWHERTVEWLEPGEKKLMERPTREARSNRVSLAGGSNVRLEELTSANPFDKVIRANQFTFQSSATHHGVECDQLEVVTQLGGRDSTVYWALGVADHLPRRIERIVDSSMMKGSMIAEISEVVIERETPSFTAADLRIARPEGYNEDRKVPPAPGPINPASRPDYDGPRGPGGDMGPPKVPEAKAPIPMAAPTYPPAPAFKFTTSDDRTMDNAAIEGKVTVLTFFGSWSPQSRDWLRKLHSVTSKFEGSADVYALAVRERGPDAAQNALERAGVTFALVPKGDDTAGAFNVKVYPSVIVIGRAGEIICSDQPARGDESALRVENAIREALAAAPKGDTPAEEKEGIPSKEEPPANADPAKKPDPSKKPDPTKKPDPMKKGDAPQKGVPAKGEPGKGDPASAPK